MVRQAIRREAIRVCVMQALDALVVCRRDYVQVKTSTVVYGLACGLDAGVVELGAGGRTGQRSGDGWSRAAAAGGLPVAMPAAAPAVTKFFPLAEVKRGMQGVAYTVFEGVNPEPMQVEILGVLKDALGPGQDMILARLHGDEAGVYGRGGGDEREPGVYRRAAGGGAELPDRAVQ